MEGFKKPRHSNNMELLKDMSVMFNTFMLYILRMSFTVGRGGSLVAAMARPAGGRDYLAWRVVRSAA